MLTYQELVTSRRHWLDTVLIPWCKVAPRKDLLLAEHEWPDLAGRPDPSMTLWKWAWERFPVLSCPGPRQMNETSCLRVTCHDGRSGEGFPDAERSIGGWLILVNDEGQTVGPFDLDDITEILET